MADKPFMFNFLGWFSACILILGPLLNGLMCLVFLKNRSMLSKPEHILLLSMAVSDFLCCVVAIPTTMISSFQGKWMFGDTGCVTHAFAVTWFGIVSISHLAALAFYKYRSMKFQHSELMSNKKTWYLALALWFYSLIFAFAPMVGWSKYTTEGLGISCSVDWQTSDIKGASYTISLFVGGFVLPVTIISFSYFKIYVEIRTMVEKAKLTWGKMSHLTKQTLKSERKMAVLFFVMIMLFLVAWTPYSVVSLISASGRFSWIEPLAASAPAYLAKSSNLFNPVLYFLLFKRFRVKVLNLLGITCLRRKTKTKYDFATKTREKEKIELKP